MPKRTRRVRRVRHVTRKRQMRKGGASVNHITQMLKETSLNSGPVLPNHINSGLNVNMKNKNRKNTQKVESSNRKRRRNNNAGNTGANYMDKRMTVNATPEEEKGWFYQEPSKSPEKIKNVPVTHLIERKLPTKFPDQTVQELGLNTLDGVGIYDWLKEYWENQKQRLTRDVPVVAPTYHNYITNKKHMRRRIPVEEYNENSYEYPLFHKALEYLKKELYFS